MNPDQGHLNAANRQVALDAAVRCQRPEDKAADILSAAKIFYEFLRGPSGTIEPVA